MFFLGEAFSAVGKIVHTEFLPWAYSAKTEPILKPFSREYMNSRFPRISEKLDNDWTFLYAPSTVENKEYLSIGYVDNKWSIVHVPHTWMTYETTGDLHPFIMNASESEDAYWWRGWGYYRKTIELDSCLKGKKFFLEFDGVQKYCNIYVNGKKVGFHKGGYNSFSVDITSFIDWTKVGQTIGVSVNGYRRDKWKIPPMTAGNWDVYSGIYRPVRLLIKNDIYIPYQGDSDHEGGTFITTPYVKDNSASIHVSTYVKNDQRKTKKVFLVTAIVDGSDSLLTTLKDSVDLLPGVITKIDQQTSILKGIHYWSDKNPFLYKVKSFVYSDKKLVDCYESPLGIRNFYWNYKTNNLYLNGEKINIRGTNRHQEYPWLGDAIPEWIMLKDLMDIKYGQGINFMRTAHYPQAPIIYDFNNQHGIITVEEVPNIKNIDFDNEVQEQNVRAMIRRDRNNPCIFFWSIGNETSDPADSKWVHEEDTTRIIHARKCEGGGIYIQHTHQNLDMENLLRITHRGWFTNEDVPSFINSNPKSGQEAGSNMWQYTMAKVLNGSTRGDLNHNCVAWLYEDHGADRCYKNSILKNMNAKGWVDMYRIPKYIYFLTKANYTDQPFLYIQSAYWRQKYIGQCRTISIDSNCDEIELFIGKQLIGRKKIEKEHFNSVSFNNVQIKKGELKAIGYIHKRPVVTQICKMPGKARRIVLKTTTNCLNDRNDRIAVITAYIVDNNGVVVFDTVPDLSWQVEGEASLVGPSLYKSNLKGLESRSGSGYEAIPVCNVVRGTGNGGEVEVTVTSSGLKTGKIRLYSEPLIPSSSLYIKQPRPSNLDRKVIMCRDTSYSESYIFSNIVSPHLSTNVTFRNMDEVNLKMELLKILKENVTIEAQSFPNYNILLNQLIAIVKRTNGLLIGDDFNFLMQQYNLYLNIERIIDSRMFHIDYAKILKEKYLNEIIGNNEQLDFQNERNLILSYPKEAIVCHVILKNENVKDSLDYDYVSRTYNLITCENRLYYVVKYFFNTSCDLQTVWGEIGQITPGISIDTINHSVKFANRLGLLIIPSKILQKCETQNL